MNIASSQFTISEQPSTSSSSISSSSNSTYTDNYDSDNEEEISLPKRPKWISQKTHPRWSSLSQNTASSANDEKSHPMADKNWAQKEVKPILPGKERDPPEPSNYKPH